VFFCEDYIKMFIMKGKGFRICTSLELLRDPAISILGGGGEMGRSIHRSRSLKMYASPSFTGIISDDPPPDNYLAIIMHLAFGE
jgi:hypothetical protein